MNCYKGSGCYPSDVCGAYLTTSSSALRISIAPKDTASPVVADIRRTTIYNGSTVETETLNGTSISGSLSLDGTVYTKSTDADGNAVYTFTDQSGNEQASRLDLFTVQLESDDAVIAYLDQYK